MSWHFSLSTMYWQVRFTPLTVVLVIAAGEIVIAVG